MGKVEVYLRICCTIGLCASVLGVASFFFVLVNINWKHTKLQAVALKKETATINQHFFLVVTNFIMGILEVLMCVYEIMLVINPVRFMYPKNGYARGLIFILSGFIVMGASASLGIAAGIVNLVCAVFAFINVSLIKCGFLKPEKPPARIQEDDEQQQQQQQQQV